MHLKQSDFFLDLSESLIVVTSDHASAVVYSGFATPKEFSVLGMDRYVSNVDKKPYQLLTYSSGLGYEYYSESSAKKDFRNSYHKATIPSTWSNHAGDDVPLYAVGSLANILFSGTMDQSYVPHAIAFAMCLFDYQNRCYRQPAGRQFEQARVKKPSKIHLVKQKLQKDFYENQAELGNSEVVNTEADLILTSDLIGTDVDSGSCRLNNNFVLVIFIMTVIKIHHERLL